MHFPIVAGIIGIAIGFEKVLSHPHDMLSIPVALALIGGYSLYIGFTAVAVWRSSKLVLIPRIMLLVISLVGVIFSIGHHPVFALGIISVCLTVTVVIEWKHCRHL